MYTASRRITKKEAVTPGVRAGCSIVPGCSIAIWVLQMVSASGPSHSLSGRRCAWTMSQSRWWPTDRKLSECTTSNARCGWCVSPGSSASPCVPVRRQSGLIEKSHAGRQVMMTCQITDTDIKLHSPPLAITGNVPLFISIPVSVPVLMSTHLSGNIFRQTPHTASSVLRRFKQFIFIMGRALDVISIKDKECYPCHFLAIDTTRHEVMQ